MTYIYYQTAMLNKTLLAYTFYNFTYLFPIMYVSKNVK